MYSDFMNNNDRTLPPFQTNSPKYISIYDSKPFPPELGSIDKRNFLDIEQADIKPIKLSPLISIKDSAKASELFTDNKNQDNTSLLCSVVSMNPECIDIAFDFASKSEELVSRFEETDSLLPALNDEITKNITFTSSNYQFTNTDEYVNLKLLIDLQKHAELLESNKNKKDYKCKYCNELFESGCALGGHISKIHRRLSKKYKQKIFKPKFKEIEKARSHFFRKSIKINKI